MKSAFSNLIKNGFLYSTNKKIDITVSNTSSYIQIHFNNTGNKITSTFDELITPFYRGENTTNIKGFGLGLAIVDRIVKLHNGDVSYTYLANNTNRFSIQLPKAFSE